MTAALRPALPFTILVGALFLASGDGLRQFRFGALNGSSIVGLLATFALIVGVLLRLVDNGTVSAGKRERRLRPFHAVPIALVVWLGWSLGITALTGGLSGTIAHPITMYIGLVAGMWLTAQRSSVGTPDVLLKWFLGASTILAAIYATQIAQYGFEPDGAITRRAFALTAMVAIAYLSAHWKKLGVLGRLLILLLGFEIAMSGSRTALLAAAVAFALAAMARNRGRLRTVFLRSLTGVAVLYALVTYWAPLRDRFLEGDGGSIGGLQINTSGREYFWGNLLRAYRENPELGGGIGEAERVMVRYTPTINQPHNDYLRILVDTGLVGLALFVIGVALLAYRLWRLAFLDDTDHRELHVAALLVLLTFLVAAYTDNPIVYPFVVYPMAAIIGCSLSRMALAQRSKRADQGGARAVDLPAHDMVQR
ncbi:O-antigen ligase family protein [Rhodococcoides corynebacterioides]|uniref:O-antigen ligase family protein n=1 Tax=Rhodococcoides corynebacterioides TaxID=53972 RepID=UPI000831443C|nr:O-antigen ligase family protein [Rhodococcus corynebacterioides]